MNYRSKSNDSFNARLRFYLFYCVLQKKELDKAEFLAFDIDKNPAMEFVNLYVTEYQQFDTKHNILTHNLSGLNNDEVYSKVKELEKLNKDKINSWKDDYFTEVFKEKLPTGEFEKLGKTENCSYCGTSINTIRGMMESKKIFKKNERGYNLELDRKEPNKEYSIENCVMACYWCNNAKTDEFSAEEFAPIGKAIGATLRNRLLKN